MADHAHALMMDTDVRGYFYGLLTEKLGRQNIPVREETIAYLTNLLARFVRAEQLYERTPDGMMIPPLAALYGDAVHAGSREEGFRALQRLGDLALFVSGLFVHSLGRSLVDVDYYIAMGGNAYAFLAESGRLSHSRRGAIAPARHPSSSDASAHELMRAGERKLSLQRRQQDLQDIYALHVAHNVDDFLCTNPELVRILGGDRALRGERESLFVHEDGEQLNLSLWKL
ncbi:MAG: hypothetical protein HYR49_06545 [Gammaproteobacteria bacterium]|nr:hypothetical protein [Gammaproteobacteria bacterium]